MKFAKSIFTGIGLMLLAGMFLAQANAQVTYTYTGNKFTSAAAPYTTAMSVTGSFTLPAPLPENQNLARIHPTSYTFSDGLNSFTELNTKRLFFSVATRDGEIHRWNLVFLGCPLEMLQCILSTNTESIFGLYPSEDSDFAFIHNGDQEMDEGLGFGYVLTRGTWTSPSPANLTSALLTYVTGNNIGPGNSLVAQLTQILTDINNNTLGLACADLQSFKNHVQAQTGKKNGPTAAQATTILEQVSAIAAALPGCIVN